MPGSLLVALTRLLVFLWATLLVPGAPGALAKSAANRNSAAPAARPNSAAGDDTTIPLPKDLTDNSDPFNAGPSSSTDATGSRYFREQQNFREQDPVRDQEGDRIIRQFE